MFLFTYAALTSIQLNGEKSMPLFTDIFASFGKHLFFTIDQMQPIFLFTCFKISHSPIFNVLTWCTTSIFYFFFHITYNHASHFLCEKQLLFLKLLIFRSKLLIALALYNSTWYKSVSQPIRHCQHTYKAYKFICSINISLTSPQT